MNDEQAVIYSEIGKILKSCDRIVSKMSRLDSERKELLATIDKLASEVKSQENLDAEAGL